MNQWGCKLGPSNCLEGQIAVFHCLEDDFTCCLLYLITQSKMLIKLWCQHTAYTPYQFRSLSLSQSSSSHYLPLFLPSFSWSALAFGMAGMSHIKRRWPNALRFTFSWQVTSEFYWRNGDTGNVIKQTRSQQRCTNISLGCGWETKLKKVHNGQLFW